MISKQSFYRSHDARTMAPPVSITAKTTADAKVLKVVIRISSVKRPNINQALKMVSHRDILTDELMPQLAPLRVSG